MISFDFKVDNKIVATFTINPDETVNIAEHNVVKNTYKTPTESEHNNIEIETIDWHKVKKFVEENDIELNEVESGVLESYLTKGTVSSSQARVLGYVLKKVQARGFKSSYPF